MNSALRLRILFCVGAAVYFLAFWHRLFLSGLVPLDGDMMRLVFPAWSIGNRLTMDAVLPLWDTYRNMGCPFLAHPPNQVLYPLHRLFPTDSFLMYMRLFVAAHALLAAVPMMLLIRRGNGSAPAAVLAALIFSFNGFVVARVTTTIDFAAYAWAPLAVYLLVSRRTGWLAAALCFQWLAGFPTFSLMTGLLLVVVAATGGERRSGFRCLLAAGVVALGLGAIQIFPFVEMMHRSARSLFLPPDVALAFALPLKSLLAPLFSPAAIFHRFASASTGDPAVTGFFIGPFVTVLAVVGAALRRSRFLAAAAAIFFLFTLGSALPLYAHIPGMTLFRFPAHWLFPALFTTALLAAAGLDRLRSSRVRWALVALVAGDLLVYAWPAHSAWAEPAVLEQKPRELAMTGGAVPTGRVFFEPALVELSAYWSLKGPEDWERLIAMGLPSIGAGYGVREVASRHQLPSASFLSFLRRLSTAPPRSPLFDAAGVSTIVRLKHLPEGVPVADDFSITTRAGAAAPLFSTNGNAARVLLFEGGRILGEATGPGRLVLSEAADPGWKARIDGKSVVVDTFEGAFPSVDVPDGTHVVLFLYRPAAFVWGSVVTLLTLALLLGIYIRRLRLRRSMR